MMIDYNGDVLICSNDWKKEAPVGNIKTEVHIRYLGK